jgi:hypothetical protein
MTKEWGELNINWHLVHSTRRFGLPMVQSNKAVLFFDETVAMRTQDLKLKK